ncbi:MAG TPA: hypothetical protein DCM05_11510 [Elusimicrobia bacterium]|nr:hypothetical protein [Elusimicrobiota bacterium]
MEQTPDPVDKLLEDLSLRLSKVDLAPPPGPRSSLGKGPRPAARDRPAAKKPTALRFPAAAFVLVLGAALAAVLWLVRHPKPAATVSIPYPASRPASLAVKDGQYVSFDRSSKELVRLDSDGSRVVERQAFPSPAAALSINKSCLWSVDAVNRKIYRHHPDSCSILETFESPGLEPSAIFSDGDILWTADRAARRVYRHAKVDRLPVLSSNPIADEDPVDLARVGEHLWVLDGDSSRVSRYRIDKPFRPAGNASLQDFLPAGSVPVGFALEGRWLWVMTRNPSSLHRIPANALRFSSH